MVHPNWLAMKDKVAGLDSAVNVAQAVKRRKKTKKRKVPEEEKKLAWKVEGGLVLGQDWSRGGDRIRSHWDLLDRGLTRRDVQEEWSSERWQLEYEDALDMEDKFQGFLRQREEEKRKVKEEVQDEEEVCSLHPLPDRQPDWWDERQERNYKRKNLGLSDDMCNFLEELLQGQGKAGDEEERKMKDDANKDKLCEANNDKQLEAKQGNLYYQAWCGGPWAQNAQKESLVRPGLVSLEKRREREEIEEREAMRKRAHNEAMWWQDQEARRLRQQKQLKDCLSRGLHVFPWEHQGPENRDEEGRWIWPRVQAPPQLLQAHQQLHPQPRLQPQLQAQHSNESGDSSQLTVVGVGLSGKEMKQEKRGGGGGGEEKEEVEKEEDKDAIFTVSETEEQVEVEEDEEPTCL